MAALFTLQVACVGSNGEHHTTTGETKWHPEIVAWAFQRAVQQQDHQRITTLSLLLENIAPKNFRGLLTRAVAQFNFGQPQQAVRTLIGLIDVSKSTREPVLQSIALLLSWQSQEALSFFNAAVEAQPNDAGLIVVSALLSYELNMQKEFRERLERALQLQPNWETAAILKLTHFQSELSIWKLFEFADNFLKRVPNAEDFRILYTKLLLTRNQPEKALAHSKIAIMRATPSQLPEALLLNGLAHLESKNFLHARKQLQQLLTVHTHRVEARLYLADLEIKQQNWEAARAFLQKIYSPQYLLDAQFKLSLIIAKQNGIEAGIHHIRQTQVYAEQDAVRIFIAQSRLYENFDLPYKALAVLNEALQETPKNSSLLYERGLLAANLNLLTLHERDLRLLIANDPNNPHFYNALGYTLASQTERLDEALVLITRALKMLPNDPAILDSMGWINFQIGNHAEAVEHLRRALDEKKDAEIAAHLGEVLWVIDHKTEAMQIWQQGKKWSSNNKVLRATMHRFTTPSIPVDQY